MAIIDNEVYGLTGGQVKELAAKVKAGGGGSAKGSHELTEADYNWNSSTKSATEPYDSVALHLLAPGWYYRMSPDVTIYLAGFTWSGNYKADANMYRVGPPDRNKFFDIQVFGETALSGADLLDGEIYELFEDGSLRNKIYPIINSLDYTTWQSALSANQGRILNEKIGKDLTKLVTDDKSSLIAAINEVAGKEGGGSGITELTEADYNWNSVNNSNVEPFDTIATWLLPTGIYSVSREISQNVVVTASTVIQGTFADYWHRKNDSPWVFIRFDDVQRRTVGIGASSKSGADGNTRLMQWYYPFWSNRWETDPATAGNAAADSGWTPVVREDIANSLNADFAYRPLSASQGKILNDRLTALEEGGGSGVEITQTPGGSTTSVMSQDATTKLIYTNTTNRESIKIGEGANGGTDNNRTVTIGKDAATTSNRGISLGTGAMVSGDYGVALGAGSSSSAKGEVSFGGSGLGTNGYNNTSTRLLTNVHDPINAQDAATKGYVDSVVGNIESALTAINEGSN